MTTIVKIVAHCSPDREVVVMVTGKDAGYDSELLEDGQSVEKAIYDDRTLTVWERVKGESLG